MTTIDHAIATSPPGRTKRRAAGLLAAGLLQAALIYALIVGLDIKIWPEPERPPLQGEFLPDKSNPLPPPPPPSSVEPTRVTVVEPTVVWSDNGGGKDTAPTTAAGPAAAPVAVAAQGIMSTHSKPPYPRLALTLGHQGTVMLRVTISARGAVQDAVVVRSSGYETLDQAARSWVIQQWRYRPATLGGQPVASTAEVVIKFDLQNAG